MPGRGRTHGIDQCNRARERNSTRRGDIDSTAAMAAV
jgi:hypothetical protein